MTEAAIVCEPAGSSSSRASPSRSRCGGRCASSAARRGVGRSAGLDPPFVGRERELRLLKDLFHATEGGRRAPRQRSPASPASASRGSRGSSRSTPTASPTRCSGTAAAASSYGEGVAFWALAEMVRMRARIAEDEPATTAEPKLEAVVDEWVTDPSDRDWVTPPLRHLLGLAQIRRRRPRAALPGVAEVLRGDGRAAAGRARLRGHAVGRQALLDFVEYLMEWSRDHRLFVVALARPELAERRPGWGAASRSFTSLALEPLPREAMGELVAGMVPGLPADAVARIAARGRGRAAVRGRDGADAARPRGRRARRAAAGTG